MDDKKLTQPEIKALELLCKELLKELKNMNHKELLEEYLFMCDQPLFEVDFILYDRVNAEESIKHNVKGFIAHFERGLNMMLTKLQNYELVKTFNFFDNNLLNKLFSKGDEDK